MRSKSSLVSLAGKEGVGAAVAERDAPFGDYSQAPPGGKPDPENVIHPRGPRS
jgi:enoyl-CoA hydratase